ncbi:hypothetical protein C823_007629 [Eubacterium plexicaudatum ASF492]|uniref:Uncharacterized protein n=1 Tax=Eubacterium plexicaudatum ASF492 TaxID=1235802 RepID=N1ZWP0_9FIRM|nr:hypothetical protein C823_007629 [Eubacterium plexicaudatum ASF492]
MDNKEENLKIDNDDSSVLINDSNTSKKNKILSNKNYKSQNCKVISYNKNNKTLDVQFNGYGIRIKNVLNFDNTITEVSILYKSEIGKPDFEYKL